MAFNLKRKKIAIAPIPPLGDVAYNPDNPMRISWEMAAAKMLPQYKVQDPTITDIDAAMARLGKNPEDVMQEAQSVNTETLGKQENVVNIQEQIQNQIQNAIASKLFNLKTAKIKTTQSIGGQPPMDSMGLNDTPEFIGDQFEEQDNLISMPEPPFSKVEDFRHWADNTETFEVLQQISGPNGDHLKEAMEQYYASMDEGEKGQIAAQIFSDPSFPLREEQGIMGQHKSFGEVDDAIKKVAQKIANKYKAKVFNLKKTAQHKTMDNAILWGPGQSQIDPFLKQPVSDWHIVERNKGFGLVVDDVWNIDYETIWRENIMDKYSRPYKDKEGNWVGGYLNKRFEIDRNIPPENNMQLKPGQTRKPILPEYGNTESRLQAARAAGEIEGANDKSKPFNWKEASRKKKAIYEEEDDLGGKWLKDQGEQVDEMFPDLSSFEGNKVPDEDIRSPFDQMGIDEYTQEILQDPSNKLDLEKLRNLVEKKQQLDISSPEYDIYTQEIASIAEKVFGTANPLGAMASSKKKS